ncbi:MAG TPA: HAMP domain-containing sensor histidine kinase [Chryseolinea sp.]
MKLLNRTIKNYLLYSVLLILCCTPLFYFSIHYLFVHDMDQELLAHKEDFNQSVSYLKSKDGIEFYQLMNKEFLLIPGDKFPAGDSLYTMDLYDSAAAELEPHRILSLGVTVNGKPYELQIRESMVNNRELIAAIMSIQVLLLALLLIGLVIINRRLTRTIWGPFYVILDRLKKYHIDQEKALELPTVSTAEFRELCQAIMQLVDKSHEAYLSQKEFTENASHELQTPLAISFSKLELLAQTNELTQEQAELVGKLFDAIERISRLNKNLLLLSKIENRQFFETEKIELSAVIQKSLDVYERQAEEKGIAIEKSLPQSIALNANPVLVEVLISNLVSNAIRHARPQSVVSVIAAPSSVTITNEGPPLVYPEKIFHRFHRESKNIGSGLGLSIVKKICDVSGYQISYLHNSNTHRFQIKF